MGSHKISNGLVALSSAAILAVYAAGYERTNPAAIRFAARDQRKPIVPVESQFVAPAQALGPIIPGQTPAATTSVPDTTRANKVTNTETSPSRSVIDATVAQTTSPDLSASVPQSNTLPSASVNDEQAPTIAIAEPVAAPVTAAPSAAAPTSTPAAVPSPVPAPVQQGYKDGTYTGWGSCRHGDIQASVVIEGGRIASATISQCYTRYPCSWISNAPGQVVSRQSIDVDYVSGATQSINAFRDAVFEALSLSKAK
jgi:uncharacterized protein with FMN-binding domain